MPIVAPKASLKELSKNIDADYLGLTTSYEATEAGAQLHSLEDIEAEAEQFMRSDEAALAIQEQYVAKKRRRIELLQSQTKEVPVSKLSVD